MNSKWFSFTKECRDSDIRVILFPHSGAGASFFASWGKTFAAANMDLYPVQYPMRESRMKDKAFTDLRVMLRAFADDSQCIIDCCESITPFGVPLEPDV